MEITLLPRKRMMVKMACYAFSSGVLRSLGTIGYDNAQHRPAARARAVESAN